MPFRVLALLTAAVLLIAACSSTGAAPSWTFAPASSAAAAAPTAGDARASSAPAEASAAQASATAVPSIESRPAASPSVDHEAHHPTTSPSGAPPAAPGDVEVVMTDAMRFEPGTISVKAGEEVTFVVENAGVIPHEFFVGDEEAQEHHAAEMAAGTAHAHDALRLEGGESGRLSMTFDEPGTLLVGCHEPGHYAAGMVGTVEILEA